MGDEIPSGDPGFDSDREATRLLPTQRVLRHRAEVLREHAQHLTRPNILLHPAEAWYHFIGRKGETKQILEQTADKLERAAEELLEGKREHVVDALYFMQDMAQQAVTHFQTHDPHQPLGYDNHVQARDDLQAVRAGLLGLGLPLERPQQPPQ